MTGPRLRAFALAADVDRFVGRETELAAAERFLAVDSPSRVLHVHGPGGIGKSAFLRELMRRAPALGYTARALDGRGLSAAEDVIPADLAATQADGPPLVVIDEVDALGPRIFSLREALFDALPVGARIVLAGRSRPDRSWLEGLPGLVVELELDALDDAQARDLLAAAGLTDPDAQAHVLRWAAGSPLALTIASSAPSADRASPTTLDVGERLLHLIGGAEIEHVDRDVLEVAALTWAVDSRLLAAALPGRGTRRAMAELSALSFVERSGHRIVLHPLVAQVIRDRLRLDEPDRFRAIRRRIAEHLAARAIDGDARALHELTDLIEDPSVRRGAGLDPSTSHYAEPLRPAHLDALRAIPGLRETAAWTRLEPWLITVPGFATVVSRLDGSIVAIAVYVPATAMPDWAESDPSVAPVLEYLRVEGLDPSRALVGIAPHSWHPLDADELAEVVRVANAVMVLRTGIVNPRYLAARFWADASVPAGFLASLGYREIPALRQVFGGQEVATWVGDFGPGGLVGFVAAIVATETGGDPVVAVSDRPSLLSVLATPLRSRACSRLSTPSSVGRTRACGRSSS